MRQRHRILALAAALLWVRPGALAAQEFFPTRDQNELLRGFYVPLPSDARLDAGAASHLQVAIGNREVEQQQAALRAARSAIVS